MRGLICIGVYAAPGTSTLETGLAEKMAILVKVFDACRREGMEVNLFATGDPEAVRKVIPGIPLYGVWDADGKQKGEAAIVEYMARVGAEKRADWVIKIAGDTFFPRAGWADRLIALGETANADLVATIHHRPDWITTQVFAARTSFLVKTWPGRPGDYSQIGVEAVWAKRIESAGLWSKWNVIPSTVIHADGTSNCVPADPAISYCHSHSLAGSVGWIQDTGSVKPDPTIKVSVVCPARNETGVNHKGESLVLRTYASIAETAIAGEMPVPEGILVDDGSNKVIPVPHDYPGKFRLIRNPVALGVDPARNVGILGSTGDVVGVLDPHMECQTQQGKPIPAAIQTLATLAAQRNALVCARCAHLELPTLTGEVPLCGATFLPLTQEKSTLAITWHNFTPPEGIRRINAVLGASYFAPRDLWDRMQGFVDSCQCWGYSEEGISLKAAMLGIPIFYCGDVTISHWFREHGPHPYVVDNGHKFLNRAKVLKVCFDEATYNKVWVPRLKASIWEESYDAALVAHDLQKEAAKFRAVKTVSDAQVMKDIFGLTI